jgi:hypothetical protein
LASLRDFEQSSAAVVKQLPNILSRQRRASAATSLGFDLLQRFTVTSRRQLTG